MPALEQWTAAMLIAAAALFVAGASVPSLQPAWATAPAVLLRVVAEHGRTWRWANASFAVAVVTNALGMGLLRRAQLPGWTGRAAVLFGLAGVLSIISGRPRVAGFPPLEPPVLVYLVPLVVGVALI